MPNKNQGRYLEKIINRTNHDYWRKNLGLITKIPTNYVLKPSQNGSRVQYSQNLNCDYIGCYQGRYLEFEAKETSLTAFPMRNIRSNQIEKLNLVQENNGLAFLIVYFSTYKRFFLVEWTKLKLYSQENKKTIPLEWFAQETDELFLDQHHHLDYLSKINRLTSCTS